MSKHKKANKPYEITNGVTRLARCWKTKKAAESHLNFIGRLSKRLRKINIYANFKVQKRTDSVYAVN